MATKMKYYTCSNCERWKEWGGVCTRTGKLKEAYEKRCKHFKKRK